MATSNLTMVEILLERWADAFSYTLYVVAGGTVFITNSLIYLTVMRHPPLRQRKEMLMIALLAFVDSFVGAHYLTAGVYRLYLIGTLQDLVLVTSWSCLWTAHNMFFIFGGPASEGMMICVTIDRLIAVYMPLKYYKYTRRYTLLLVAPFYGYAAFMAVWAVVVSYTAPTTLSFEQICFVSASINFNMTYYYVYQYGKAICGIVPVVLYLFVWYKVRRSFVQIGIGKTQEQRQYARQRRVTVTIGISTVFTLLFFVVPNAILLVINRVDIQRDTWFKIYTPILSMMINVNAIANVFIYTMRHNELRKGMKMLLAGNVLSKKQMDDAIYGTKAAPSHKSSQK